MIVLLLLVAIALAVFYLILQLDVSGALKFALVVIEMLAVSQVLIRRYKMPSELGLVLLKGKKGVELIEGLARNEKAFNFLADVGASISYGLLSFVLMRRNTSPLTAALGLVLLGLLSFLVAPVALTFILMVAGIGSSGRVLASAGGGLDIGFYVVAGALLLGGLFLFILGGVVYYGLFVFERLVSTVFFHTNAIATTAAGGDLLLPGVNLPFFEGILALAIVMVVHEGAHAVLSRIAKVPILSSGLVLFGIIPIGAFVEPDEKKLMRTDDPKQTRVLVAGPTANLVSSLIFFALFIAMFVTTSGMREGALYVENTLPNSTLPQLNNTLIYEIDHQAVDSIDFKSLALQPGANITLLTSKGTVSGLVGADGKMGIEYVAIPKDSIFARYPDPALQFVYMLLGLCMALNFIVGTVNILPVPLFDGYRIIDINVKNKMIVKAISYAALFFFILNFLPKLFH